VCKSVAVVSHYCGARDNAFSGEVNRVQLDVGKEGFGPLISPEERLNFAMMRHGSR
jgi:hypothetical protein